MTSASIPLKWMLKRQSTDSNEHVSLSGSLRVCGNKMKRNSVYKSIKTVVFSNKLNLLIPFGPLAILVHKMTAHNVSFSFGNWYLSLLGFLCDISCLIADVDCRGGSSF